MPASCSGRQGKASEDRSEVPRPRRSPSVQSGSASGPPLALPMGRGAAPREQPVSQTTLGAVLASPSPS